MASDPQWEGITPEQIAQLLKSQGVRAMIVQRTNQLCDAANSIDPTPPNRGKIQNPNFGVYISDAGDRVRGYVHPLGRTGIHIEAGESVLLKAIAGMPKQ